MKMNMRNAITAAVLAGAPAAASKDATGAAKQGILGLVKDFMKDAKGDLKSAEIRNAEMMGNCKATDAKLALQIKNQANIADEMNDKADGAEVVEQKMNGDGTAGSITESANNIKDADDCVADAKANIAANQKQIREIQDQNKTIKQGSDDAINHLSGGSNAAEFSNVLNLIREVVDSTMQGNRDTVSSLRDEIEQLTSQRSQCTENAKTSRENKKDREMTRDQATAEKQEAQAKSASAVEAKNQATTEKATNKQTCDENSAEFSEVSVDLKSTIEGLTTYHDTIDANWNAASLFMQLRSTTSTLPGEHAAEVLSQAAAKLSNASSKQQLLQLAAAASAGDDATGTSSGAADAASKVVKVLESFKTKTATALSKLQNQQGKCQINMVKQSAALEKTQQNLDQTNERKSEQSATLASQSAAYSAADAEFADLIATVKKTADADSSSKAEASSELARFESNLQTLSRAWDSASSSIAPSVRSKVETVHNQLVSTLNKSIHGFKKSIDALTASIESNNDIDANKSTAKEAATGEFTASSSSLKDDIASLTETSNNLEIELDSKNKALTALKEVCMTTKSPQQVIEEHKSTIAAIDEAVEILKSS